MIESKAQAKRRVRDAKIKKLWDEMHTPGVRSSAVANIISQKVGVSVTKVYKVVK